MKRFQDLMMIYIWVLPLHSWGLLALWIALLSQEDAPLKIFAIIPAFLFGRSCALHFKKWW